MGVRRTHPDVCRQAVVMVADAEDGRTCPIRTDDIVEAVQMGLEPQATGGFAAGSGKGSRLA
jgi:hypothetical protein